MRDVAMPRRLRFTHPRMKQVVAVEAPLPPEFVRTLAMPRAHRSVK
ncbi:MAG: hypothetical protein HYR84_08515 [Planctomycetes bacterium]|nr:hypothetical protein [Planctomycetota bacterium]